MNRRTFISEITFGLLVAPLAAEAQHSGKRARLGFLASTPASAAEAVLVSFREGLREVGWVEGQTIEIDYRLEGIHNQLAPVAIELVQRKVDVIVTWGTPAGMAAKRATTTIPIVSFSATPVEEGLVESLAHPGGNITGIASIYPELRGKRLELFKDLVPGFARLFVLWNPSNQATTRAWHDLAVPAKALGVKLQGFEVRERKDIEAAFLVAARERSQAVFVVHDLITFENRARIAESALKQQLPTMFPLREYVDAGGLISYGVSFPDLWRRMASIVDKILKGAKPADIPVEQPTKFDLVINLKTAKALGLTIPPSLLGRADQVIQ